MIICGYKSLGIELETNHITFRLLLHPSLRSGFITMTTFSHPVDLKTPSQKQSCHCEERELKGRRLACLPPLDLSFCLPRSTRRLERPKNLLL